MVRFVWGKHMLQYQRVGTFFVQVPSSSKSIECCNVFGSGLAKRNLDPKLMQFATEYITTVTNCSCFRHKLWQSLNLRQARDNTIS